MKNKLKMFFGYFRGFKAQEINTIISYDYHSIADWNQNFYVIRDGESITVEPQGIIVDLLEEIVGLIEHKFHKYNDYNLDDWWVLHVKILPFENKINFQSECKVWNETYEELDMEVSELPDTTQNKINNIINENDITKFSFDFTGHLDHLEIPNLFFNDNIVNITNKVEVDLYDILDVILIKQYGPSWSDDGGITGEIVIWGGDIFMYNNIGSSDWNMTDMNITITLDDIIEYEK